MTGNYYIDLFKVIGENMYNDYQDNYDYIRYGPEKKEKVNWRSVVRKKLNQRGYFNKSEPENFAKSLDENLWIEDFKYLYDLFKDHYSKWLLLQIVAYRLLGYRKVKLPLSTKQYWKNISELEKHEKKNDYIETGFMDMKLYYMDLSFLNVPIKFYFSGAGLNIDFIIKQYDFNRDNIKIQVAEGDTVIDAGGCWGDTALYFAYRAGKKGDVHSFEFIPDNLAIWKRNIELNPNFEQNIILAENPLWSDSNINMFFKANGPGSKVSFEKFDDFDGIVQTISIDDYVNEKSLSKVDFIKMDIEGAELSALKGANQTIRTFKPKLAVALYHNTKDFHTIPKYLEELNLGYQFFLSHATINAEETMLFAIADK